MNPATMLKKSALLVFALAVFATPVKADELWVAPAKNPADTLIADFAVAQKKTHFGFGVPDTFNGFTRATVLLIGSKNQDISYDLRLSISQHLASDTALVTEIRDIRAHVFRDRLLELDVSAIFNGAPALQPGTDYVSLSIDISTPRARRSGDRGGKDERNESSSKDTDDPHALVFGLRFQYEGPLGPTLAALMCPPGQVLQGINANGTPACVPLAAGPAPDTTPPTVTFVNPAALATGVCVTETIAATFSEAMDPSTITNLTFTVAGVTGTVTYDALTRIATFTPQSNLPGNTLLTATITTGVRDLAGNALAGNKVWSFTTGPPTCSTPGPTPVNLGTLSTFVAVAGAGLTNSNSSGFTTLNGDVGLSPTATCLGDGAPCTATNPIINGTLYANDPEGVAAQAKVDLTAAYVDATSRPVGTTVSDISGLVLPPGVYTSGSTMSIAVGGAVTLDGQGDANAVWIFQIGSSLTVNNNALVLLTNGAQAKNVFWAVFASSTLGSDVIFQGSILAGASNSVGTDSVVVGRLLSMTGQITLLSNTVTLPAP